MLKLLLFYSYHIEIYSSFEYNGQKGKIVQAVCIACPFFPVFSHALNRFNMKLLALFTLIYCTKLFANTPLEILAQKDKDSKNPIVFVEIKNIKSPLQINEDHSLSRPYAQLIEKIECFDKQNKIIKECKFDEKSLLISSMPYASIKYQVPITHHKFEPKYGTDEIPFVYEDGFFLTGRALFAFPTQPQSIVVNFLDTKVEDISTPWHQIGNESKFIVNSGEELYNTYFFWGKQQKFEFSSGKTKFRMSIDTKIPEKTSKNISKQMSNVFASYVKFFGIPKGEAFYVRLNKNNASKKGSIDGGVFGHSIVIGANIETYEENSFGLYLVPSHELGHLWNPGVLKNDNGVDYYWFSEGFTDYYTMLIMYNLKIIEKEKVFLDLLHKYGKEYNKLRGQLSLQEAGKAKNENFGLIYSGGRMTALYWDIIIREKTNNKNSLWSLMDALYSSARKGKSINLSLIQNELKKIIGEEKSQELISIVTNPKGFDVNMAFNKIGYEINEKSGELTEIKKNAEITTTLLFQIP